MATPLRLRESSSPHSYYLGDYQGTLQYNKPKEEITALTEFNDEETNGYVLETHTMENKLRAFPRPQSEQRRKNPDDYKLVLVMKSVREEGVWLKVAYEHKTTGHIMLMSSTNNRAYITNGSVEGGMDSHDPGWFVGAYRMAAPMCFWKELKNRLTV
jgi:hypothetical protein